MKFSKFRQKAINVTRLLENPKLISLRNKKINLEIYEILNEPWIHDLKIATLLDIGSNTGHFALAFNSIFPKVKIYSFEPIPECFRILEKSIENIQNMKAFNLGLGNQAGNLNFEQSKNSLSSSFRKMTNVHKLAFPDTSENETISVTIEKLDTIQREIDIIDPLLIKIDVQGFEDQVLEGGQRTIQRAKMVIIETSFIRLYEAQPLFDDVYLILKKMGFIYGGAIESLHDPITGRVLQEDSIFLKDF
jgi:FkbM family methyltransferase